ncbi:MAG: radical SAM protein [Oscillospiraceae bacterium]|nr:radical SAM protein [Oscillospiraceae bacterium]
MLIGLHDAEYDHMPNKEFPNYALMKISAWHKSQGDKVELFTPTNPEYGEQQTMFETEYPMKRNAYFYDYDKIYSSKVFDFTPENKFLPEHTVKGGTGYGIYNELPIEIDKMFPDYSIYPNCDYAIGFLTRGCVNNCSWCVVPPKEGKIYSYRKWQDVVRNDTDKLLLMDNNILACDYGISQLAELSQTDYKIDINQGMDIRLLTDEICKILKKIKWIKYIRFSCDRSEQLPYFEKMVEMFDKYKISKSKVFIYLLVQKDLDEADYRVQSLKKMYRSFNLSAQAERNEAKGIIPSEVQLTFAQRYVYSRTYKNETWVEYCKRHHIKNYK